MSEISSEHRSAVYGSLKLYESLLGICFEVVNMRVASTVADDLYVYLGLRDTLHDLLVEIGPQLPKKLPNNLLPESISGMTEKEYAILQGGFGVIKTYAKTIKAHGAEIDADTRQFIDDAEKVRRGESVSGKVLLKECSVQSFNYETNTLVINDTPIEFGAAQEDYFLWAMFQHPLNTSVAWDEILDEITEAFGDSEVFDKGKDSVRQAMHRVNRKIRGVIDTSDNLFSHKSGGYKRHFGPEVTE